MTTETARLVAGVLARRLGIESAEFETTLADNPLGAILALSMQDPSRQAEARGPARTLSLVARMVGACEACLGEDEACGSCHGLGKPGTRAADTDSLIRWISLPLHQAGLCVGRPRSMPADHNQQGGYVR